jgi:penicillin-binding protein 1C
VSNAGARRRSQRRAALMLGLALCIALYSAPGFYALAHAAVPTPAAVKADWHASDAWLLDRHGELLQGLRIDMQVRRQPWVALADVSPALQSAILRAEDQRFYQHGGVDLEAVARSAWDNLFRRRPRGASTLSMQLAALLDPALQPKGSQRSWGQKWDQLGAARALEAGWSKAQIFEAYLNLVYFRGELQGVGAASSMLFGKAPSGLDRSEAAILAALIRAPNVPATVLSQRACSLLQGDCTDLAEMVNLVLHRNAQAVQGPAAQVAQKLLKVADRRVTSTLDGGLQRVAQDSLRAQILALRERNVNDGAAIVLDNASGEILAYVANAGDSSVDGVAALRQAGSTLKPFLYELAIEKKLLTAGSILDDSAIEISTPAGLYVPQNYDKDFKGYASVRTSLGNSLNVPAVRTLVMTGLHAFYQRLKAVGISSLAEAPEYYGYALALGSAEVSLQELTNAYRVLATGGRAGALTLVPRAPGTPADQRRVLDAGASFIVSDILADRAARNLTFGLHSELSTPYWSAVKTGTSKDMRDNWCIGYTERYTVGVWVGNFDGEPMWDVSGVTGAAPIWRDLMDYLQRDGRSTNPAPPPGVIAQDIHYLPALEPGRREWFMAGTQSRSIELLAAAQQQPKIRYPGEGTIIALDPDIPPARQKVQFLAQAGDGMRWRLDDDAAVPVNGAAGWTPVPGLHRLRLLGTDEQERDAISFRVRGLAAEAP